MKTERCLLWAAQVALLAMLAASPAQVVGQASPVSASGTMVLHDAFLQKSAVLLPEAQAILDRFAAAMLATPAGEWGSVATPAAWARRRGTWRFRCVGRRR